MIATFLTDLRKAVGVFWAEWEPHLAFAGAFSALAYLRATGHPFDPMIEGVVLAIAGGPEARDAIVNIIKAWKNPGA
jgi:hypothetical protein